MSMIHSHRALDANAHAKLMIDAVTGHQPSPLDSEYSSKTPATQKQKLGEKSAKTHRIENEYPPAHQVAGDFRKARSRRKLQVRAQTRSDRPMQKTAQSILDKAQLHLVPNTVLRTAAALWRACG